MWNIDRKKAYELGYTPEEVDAYLNGLNQQEQTTSTAYIPAPAPTPPLSSQSQPINPQAPDVVNPFPNPQNQTMTQGLGENPYYYGQGAEGHEGIDLVNDNPDMTNPIGGLNVSGTNPGGYGNWQAIIGASPEELAQMTQEEKDKLRRQVGEYIINQPANIRDLNVDGKNVSLQAHLAEPAPNAPELATGSAKLKMGNTGFGTGPHLHQVYKDTKGNMRDLMEVIRNMTYR